MVIDRSAVAAILLGEADREVFLEAIATDPIRLISSVNAFEAVVVVEASKGKQGGRDFDLLLHTSRIDIVPLAQQHVFGPHASKIEIFLENASVAVSGIIDRKAQTNGTPRIICYASLKHYFQSRFKKGDIVDVVIESPQRIRLRSHHVLTQNA